MTRVESRWENDMLDYEHGENYIKRFSFEWQGFASR